jgi:hypothetical protein
MKMPELRHVPLLQKVLECIIRSQSSSAVLLLSPTGGENPLATDNSKHQEAQIVDLSITFEHFLSLLSVFSVKQSIIEKRKGNLCYCNTCTVSLYPVVSLIV